MMLLHHLVGVSTPAHVNADWARRHSPAGAPTLAPSVLLALAAAGWARTGLHGAVLAAGVRFRGTRSITGEFRRPVVAGDTLYGVYRIGGFETDVMRIGFAVENQAGEVVIDGEVQAQVEPGA